MKLKVRQENIKESADSIRKNSHVDIAKITFFGITKYKYVK